MLQFELAVFGPGRPNTTVSRLIDALAALGEKALDAVRRVGSEVRSHFWSLTEYQAPNAGREVIIDLDGSLIVAHSDKQDAAPTRKKAYGPPSADGFRRLRARWNQ